MIIQAHLDCHDTSYFYKVLEPKFSDFPFLRDLLRSCRVMEQNSVGSIEFNNHLHDLLACINFSIEGFKPAVLEYEGSNFYLTTPIRDDF